MKLTYTSRPSLWHSFHLVLNVIILGMCAIKTQVTATELTFDITGFSNFSNMSQDYGDNVTAATMGDFSYGSEGGFTPNVDVSYGPNEAAPTFWTTGYGDLENILFEDVDNLGVLEVTFTA